MDKRIQPSQTSRLCGEEMKRSKYKSLNHGSTVIVTKSFEQLKTVVDWAFNKGKIIPGYISRNNSFPFCISVDGDCIGYTEQMDRALYYMPYDEFLKKARVKQPENN